MNTHTVMTRLILDERARAHTHKPVPGTGSTGRADSVTDWPSPECRWAEPWRGRSRWRKRYKLTDRQFPYECKFSSLHALPHGGVISFSPTPLYFCLFVYFLNRTSKVLFIYFNPGEFSWRFLCAESRLSSLLSWLGATASPQRASIHIRSSTRWSWAERRRSG